jgi:hypothetical protein
MNAPHSLILFDASAILAMFIIAYLSRRLGEALKIRPYYRILYVTAVLLAVAAIVDVISNDFNIHVPQGVPILVRFASAGAAFLVCLKYWNWAFSEYLKR